MSVRTQLEAERRKLADIDERIAVIKAREAERLGRLAEKSGLYDVDVSDADLAAGFTHAIALATERTAGAG